MLSARRLLSLSFLLIASCSLWAGDLPQVVESSISAQFAAAEITVSVPVKNAGTATSAWVRLELIDVNDTVLSQADERLELAPGVSTASLHLPNPNAVKKRNDKDDLLWYRLRYRVAVEPSGGEQSGIVALAAVAPNLFSITYAHPRSARAGAPYLFRVHAANPVTQRPVPGVDVRATLAFDNQAKPATISRLTNATGDAVFSIALPRNIDKDSGQIKLQAHKAGLVRNMQFDLEWDSRATIVVSTDKQLYQPGQTLHVRALALGPDHRAFADKQFKFTLKDPEGELVLAGAAKTNRFGIANIDWDLASNLRLGDYSVAMTLNDDDAGDDETGNGMAGIRVSRYDLPNFTVTAKTERTYYLPGQDADLTVSAQYLFGKPVKRGTVRVVHETERTWNYKEQKWDIDEGETFRGELDGAGIFKLHLNLAKAHAEFHDTEYRRFDDLTYAVYVTDTTTGRTEQHRLKVRLSHDPIHIYVAHDETVNGRTQFYVTTFYPDGTPARCHVQVSEMPQTKGNPRGEQLLRKVQTNRYGVAKVESLKLGEGDEYHSHKLVLVATDRTGATARHEDNVWTTSSKLAINTDKTLYKSGEPIMVAVRSDRPFGAIAVDLAIDGIVLRSTTARLHNGHASVVFPYEPQFRGAVAIAAYSLEQQTSRYHRTGTVHRVLYPHNTQLNVQVKPDQKTYRPGEEVRANLRVRSPSGTGGEAAFGVVVLDKAVEERVRTNEEFAHGNTGFWDWDWLYWREGGAGSAGGVTRADLDKIDMSKPLPDGLDLVADIILNGSGGSYFPEVESDDYDDASSLFRERVQQQLKPVLEVLRLKSATERNFPTNAEALRNLLHASGIQLSNLRDPWNAEYRVAFSVDEKYRTITFTSAGPDKQVGTSDDFQASAFSWNYFEPVGQLMNRAVAQAYDRAGTFVRDYASLRREMLSLGVDLDTLRDPWGNPFRYEFEVRGRNVVTNVYTGGSDPRHPYHYPIWTSAVDYFRATRTRIDTALLANTRALGHFPQNDAELEAALRPAGISMGELRDPWRHPYYAAFRRLPQYGDFIVLQYGDRVDRSGNPVTRELDWIYIYSSGPDGKPNTADDVQVASFSNLVSVQSGKDLKPRPVPSAPLEGGTGAISGTVTDKTGAAIPNAKVTAKRDDDTTEYSATTNNLGKYLIRGLPAGRYRVEAAASNFATTVIRDVPVFSSNETVVNTALNVGRASQTVNVEASVETLQTQSAMMSSVSFRAGLPGVSVAVQNFTPRLRQYFPETLYWAPSLITDKYGNTRLKFKLADNITTWKLGLVASTVNGEVGTAETEITAFQPFFVEHDPPRVLTVGDRIAMPVVIRNYLDRAQKVEVDVQPAPWMSLLGDTRKTVTIAAGDSGKPVFPFRATSSVTDAKQRITAANPALGDAIEKPVTVHPHGRETSSLASRMISGTADIPLNLPSNIIAGSLQAELKIYPNLLAHVVDAIEGSLHRPYGCGEQTISSTYPSVLLARYYREHNLPESAMSRRANKFVLDGYQRLQNYRAATGAFTYWGRGDGDVALTSYALRFLQDASTVIHVDEELTTGATKWLLKKQNADGSWSAPYGSTPNLTVYVARELARSSRNTKPNSPEAQALARAMKYVQSMATSQDPYFVASYALTASAIAPTLTDAAIARLRTLVHREADSAYWTLETNTPFYGWGHAGRIETTALALQALATGNADSAASDDLVRAGLSFLLRNKDRYGVWYSGQATVNVLQTLLSLLTTDNAPAAATKATVIVNGAPALTLDIPAHTVITGPVSLDISRWLKPGANTVQVRMGNVSLANMQVRAAYYVPWDKAADQRESTELGDSRALRLGVRYDKTQLREGDEVRCTVTAERIGHRGYGMLLAEIGLPPGADVDRASLAKAMENSYAVQRYDILPDRVIVYLWPQAGGTKFDFTFRPRFGMEAFTAPSLMYDYYNPDSQVVLAPERFAVDAGVPLRR